ncbi:MAG: hypothetical protein R3192_17310, partial [Woeseiaceae bacterium]|nr:hypothetical protein [Woeseiaceae bacterium]
MSPRASGIDELQKSPGRATLKFHPGNLHRLTTFLVAVLLISACSSGGGDDGGASNRAPTANAGHDQTVVESSAVQLTGSGSDPDAGDSLSFSWSQISGTSVTIANPTSANATFTAPDVAAGNPEMLGFRLTVTDAAGLTATDEVIITVQEPGEVVTISGTMLYEFPPPLPMCNGLNFLNLQERPIRRATVQALDETGSTVLDSDVTDDLGGYSLTVTASTNVIIRVRAELKQGGNPSWDVEVRNNVDTSPSPPPLAQRPIYVMDSSVMDSGVVDSTVNLTATTGWDSVSQSFTGPRSASPFAVLDAIWSAMELVMATDPGASFVPLDAFWSPDNTSSEGSGTFSDNVASGEIGTSFYSGDQLFLLGKDGDDVEEFDDHVIVHEWGHYFEDNFSRSDSIGGAHSIGDILDMRVAFGEGWATALSGIALDNPIYCDTLWFAGTLSGFEIDIESEGGGTPGWFNEISIMKIVYDLWDTNDDGADNSSIGFDPIYDVMAGPQANTEAFTSIFTFATELKAVSGQDAFINALLAEQDIETNTDLFGTTETNDAGAAVPGDVFPLYTDIIFGVTENICVNSQFDADRDGNKLSEHRYLRLNLP